VSRLAHGRYARRFPRRDAESARGTLLRACLDLVEHLVRQSLDVTTAEVETTLAVLEQAFNELEGGAGNEQTMNAASVALKNAIGRLKALRLELSAK
jgi:hypothetical protein